MDNEAEELWMRMFSSTLALMDQGEGALDTATRAADAVPGAKRPEIMRLIMEVGYKLEYDAEQGEFFIRMTERQPPATLEKMLAFVRKVSQRQG